jgi:SAM-dependent methyltransferase
MSIDQRKVEQLAGRAIEDLGGAVSALLVHLGDKLGLYKALATAGPLTSRELAERTGTAERYVREWLSNQAAGGYVSYDPGAQRFYLTEEQKLCLADETSPAFVLGGFESASSLFVDEAKFTHAFRTGRGVGWHEHDPRLFSGTERFFRPGYNANLVASWIPALQGVGARLEKGAKLADVGCGHGASTLVMARAYPASTFAGFDYHAPSIERARAAASQAGFGERVKFDVASAKDFPGKGYDVVAFFDCLHDMGDPVGALRHVRASLAEDGVVLLVEPMAGDRLEENLNPIGRLFYGFSTLVCCPASMAQDVGLALGAQAGEARLRNVFDQAGFTRFRRATETPFNLVFEARP